jgi:hypothetical protein
MIEVVNKIASSGLIQVDLSDYLADDSEFMPFDFKPTLWNEIALKEKDFRAFCLSHDWEQYRNKHVYLFCTVDAILPSWAYMLASSQLIGLASGISFGSLLDAKKEQLETSILNLDLEQFRDGKLIVKGCSEIPNSDKMLSVFLQKVQGVVSSIMFGEPCSTVPIYKRRKIK